MSTSLEATRRDCGFVEHKNPYSIASLALSIIAITKLYHMAHNHASGFFAIYKKSFGSYKLVFH